MQAPALIGLFPKSRYGGSDEDRAIVDALHALRGVSTGGPIPLYYGRKRVGRVIGDPHTHRARWQAATIAGLRSGITSNSQRWRMPITKSRTGTAVTSLWCDYWAVGGLPIAGTYAGTALAAYRLTDTSAGALFHGGNVTPKTKLLSRWEPCLSAGSTVFLLYDRVIQIDGIALSTTTQTINNTVTPARYNTTGDGGMQIMLSAPVGTGTTAMTMAALAYTNDSGSAKSAPIESGNADILTGVAAQTSTTGCMVPFPYSTGGPFCVNPFVVLAPGDNGAHSLTSLSTSAIDSAASTVTASMVRVIAAMVVGAPLITWETDFVTGVVSNEPIIDGAALGLMALAAPAATLSGHLEVAWT